MSRISSVEVEKQYARFQVLLEKVDLVKLGRIILRQKTNKDGLDYSYVFISRYLKKHNIGSAFYIPGTSTFYGEYLEYSAITAYMNSL